MNKPRCKIIIHIGQHKTGSKALQTFLALHAPALGQLGLLYSIKSNHRGIRAYTNSHYQLFALLRHEAMKTLGEIDAARHFWLAQYPFCQPFNTLRDQFNALEKERQQIGANIIVLSAEDLFDMHSAHETVFSMARIEAAVNILAALIDQFQYDASIIVYLRRQDHLLAAHYIQYIKGGDKSDLDFANFAHLFAPRLRSYDILTLWANAFGDNRIQIHPYEAARLPLGIVPDFFEQALDLTIPIHWVMPPRDVESMNISPDRDFVEFMRLLNRRTAQGDPVFSREDVLEAAFANVSQQKNTSGIAAWLSPSERCKLLESHAQGNADIAKRFMPKPYKPLFAEAQPISDDHWDKYAGLSIEKSIEIALVIHKIALQHQSANNQMSYKTKASRFVFQYLRQLWGNR